MSNRIAPTPTSTRPAPDDFPAQRTRILCVHELVEDALRLTRGEALLIRARAEAAAYCSAHYPWNGVGNEPVDRVCARINILVDHL